MKAIYILALLISLVIVQADLTQYVNDLPQCGLKCILAALSDSACNLSNSTCICTNTDLVATTTVCLSQNCTVIENLQVKNISDLACGIQQPSKQHYLIGTCGFGVVAVIAVLVRLSSRLGLEANLKVDDWIMAVVGVLVALFCVLGVLAAVYGFGKNIWTVGTNDLIKALRIFFINEVIYISILGLCKISILFFYLRIFPSPNFKKICYGILAWIAVCTIVIVCLTILQCIPLSYNWLGWMGDQSPAKCLNLNALTYASATINITQDLVVLLLPLPWLLRLNIGWKRKLNVITMFSLGIFVCITSIYRLTKIVSFRATTNPTYDYIEPTYWSAIETFLSVIIPCLPAVRSLLSHCFPKVFSFKSTVRGSSVSDTQSKSGLSYHMRPTSKIAVSASVPAPFPTFDEYFGEPVLDLDDQKRCRVYTGVTSSDARKGSNSDEEIGQEMGIMVCTEMMQHECSDEISSKQTPNDMTVQPGNGV